MYEEPKPGPSGLAASKAAVGEEPLKKRLRAGSSLLRDPTYMLSLEDIDNIARNFYGWHNQDVEENGTPRPYFEAIHSTRQFEAGRS